MKKLILAALILSAGLLADDFDDAIKAFKAIGYLRNCDAGDVWECNSLAAITIKPGQDINKDHQKAAKLFQKACDGGDARGCSFLGFLYERGLGVKKDYQKASELFQKACDDGLAVGCSNLGFLYHLGQGLWQDKSRAKEYYGKACDLGVQRSCNEYKQLNEQGY